MNEWVDLKSPSSEEKNTIEKRKNDYMQKIQNSEEKLTLEENVIATKILNVIEQEIVLDITQQRQREKNEEKNGHNKTETGKPLTIENTMQEIKSPEERISTPVVLEETQAMGSSRQLQILSTVDSESETILLESAKELHSAMRGLVANKPAADIKKVEPEVAMAMASLGKTVAELLKVRHVIRSGH